MTASNEELLNRMRLQAVLIADMLRRVESLELHNRQLAAENVQVVATQSRRSLSRSHLGSMARRCS